MNTYKSKKYITTAIAFCAIGCLMIGTSLVDSVNAEPNGSSSAEAQCKWMYKELARLIAEVSASDVYWKIKRGEASEEEKQWYQQMRDQISQLAEDIEEQCERNPSNKEHASDTVLQGGSFEVTDNFNSGAKDQPPGLTHPANPDFPDVADLTENDDDGSGVKPDNSGHDLGPNLGQNDEDGDGKDDDDGNDDGLGNQDDVQPNLPDSPFNGRPEITDQGSDSIDDGDDVNLNPDDDMFEGNVDTTE